MDGYACQFYWKLARRACQLSQAAKEGVRRIAESVPNDGDEKRVLSRDGAVAGKWGLPRQDN